MKILATALLLGCATLHAQETVLYRQTFGKEGEGNGDITSVNWEHFYSGEGHAWVVGGVLGQPQDLPNISTAQPEKTVYIKTDLDPSHYKSLVFRWYSGANTDVHTQRLAIQIGSRWFVSENVFQNSIGWEPFAEKALQASFAFTPDAAQWRELLIEPGNKFRLAESSLTENLPAGPVKNFGIFCENPGGAPQTSSIVDTFEIAGAPLK